MGNCLKKNKNDEANLKIPKVNSKGGKSDLVKPPEHKTVKTSLVYEKVAAVNMEISSENNVHLKEVELEQTNNCTSDETEQLLAQEENKNVVSPNVDQVTTEISETPNDKNEDPPSTALMQPASQPTSNTNLATNRNQLSAKRHEFLTSPTTKNVYQPVFTSDISRSEIKSLNANDKLNSNQLKCKTEQSHFNIDNNINILQQINYTDLNKQKPSLQNNLETNDDIHLKVPLPAESDDDNSEENNAPKLLTSPSVENKNEDNSQILSQCLKTNFKNKVISIENEIYHSTERRSISILGIGDAIDDITSESDVATQITTPEVDTPEKIKRELGKEQLQGLEVCVEKSTTSMDSEINYLQNNETCENYLTAYKKEGTKLKEVFDSKDIDTNDEQDVVATEEGAIHNISCDTKCEQKSNFEETEYNFTHSPSEQVTEKNGNIDISLNLSGKANSKLENSIGRRIETKNTEFIGKETNFNIEELKDDVKKIYFENKENDSNSHDQNHTIESKKEFKGLDGSQLLVDAQKESLQVVDAVTNLKKDYSAMDTEVKKTNSKDNTKEHRQTGSPIQPNMQEQQMIVKDNNLTTEQLVEIDSEKEINNLILKVSETVIQEHSDAIEKIIDTKEYFEEVNNSSIPTVLDCSNKNNALSIANVKSIDSVSRTETNNTPHTHVSTFSVTQSIEMVHENIFNHGSISYNQEQEIRAINDNQVEKVKEVHGNSESLQNGHKNSVVNSFIETKHGNAHGLNFSDDTNSNTAATHPTAATRTIVDNVGIRKSIQEPETVPNKANINRTSIDSNIDLRLSEVITQQPTSSVIPGIVDNVKSSRKTQNSEVTVHPSRIPVRTDPYVPPSGFSYAAVASGAKKNDSKNVTHNQEVTKLTENMFQTSNTEYKTQPNKVKAGSSSGITYKFGKPVIAKSHYKSKDYVDSDDSGDDKSLDEVQQITTESKIRINLIMQEVNTLSQQVTSYSGSKRDFLRIEELLTRALLKIDDVETHSIQEVQQYRKKAVVCTKDILARLRKNIKTAKSENI